MIIIKKSFMFHKHINIYIISIIAFAFLTLTSCGTNTEGENEYDANWAKNKSEVKPGSTFQGGWMYLPVYSHIYSGTKKSSLLLTATISIRNTSTSEPIVLFEATYYDTYGEIVREYLPHAIELAPLETVELVVNQSDESGGSGANFLFHWGGDSLASKPLIESVMISTESSQGISFTSRAVEIENQ